MRHAMHRLVLAVLTLAVGASTARWAAAQSALPALLARYEMKRGKHVEQFELLRTERRIEHRYVDRALTEVWERDARGELAHWKIFHRAGRVVHYTPGDLRTIHVEPSWEQLGTLLNPAERARLKHVGKRRVRGELVSVLRGTIAGRSGRLLWLDTLELSTAMTLGTGSDATSVQLVGSQPCDVTSCAPASTLEYREIEFADLGDSERDPFVRNFLASFSLAHEHHQHP